MMRNNFAVPQGAALTLATLRVSARQGPRYVVPEKLAADTFTPSTSAPVRHVPLTFMQMNWFIDGKIFDMETVSAAETVDAGSTHIWEFENRPMMGMGMAHPMHMHGRQFRVLSQQRRRHQCTAQRHPRSGLDRHRRRPAGRDRACK